MIEVPLFTHLFYNQGGDKTPKDVTWKMNETNDGNIEVYCEDKIFNPNNNNKIKYGWICESTEIVLNAITKILNNKDHLKQIYKKIYTNDKRLIEIDKELFDYNMTSSNVPWLKNYSVFPKKKICSFITSFKGFTTGHRKRLELFNTLKDHPLFKGHIYGRDYNPIKCKSEALNDYMFSIALENSKYPTYFTEKVTDCFASGTIPIYYGDESIENYFNKDGIIFLENFKEDMLCEDYYYSKLDAIKENFNKVCEMKTADDMLIKKILQ